MLIYELQGKWFEEKNLEDGNEILKHFETAILHKNYDKIHFFSFNLNYIAIYFFNIVKLIRITDGKLVNIIAFD